MSTSDSIEWMEVAHVETIVTALIGNASVIASEVHDDVARLFIDKHKKPTFHSVYGISQVVYTEDHEFPHLITTIIGTKLVQVRTVDGEPACD